MRFLFLSNIITSMSQNLRKNEMAKHTGILHQAGLTEIERHDEDERCTLKASLKA